MAKVGVSLHPDEASSYVLHQVGVCVCVLFWVCIYVMDNESARRGLVLPPEGVWHHGFQTGWWVYIKKALSYYTHIHSYSETLS